MNILALLSCLEHLRDYFCRILDTMYDERSLACSLLLEIIVHHQAASLVLFHSHVHDLYFLLSLHQQSYPNPKAESFVSRRVITHQSVRLYFAPAAVARRQIQQSIKGDSSAYIAVSQFPGKVGTRRVIPLLCLTSQCYLPICVIPVEPLVSRKWRRLICRSC